MKKKPTRPELPPIKPVPTAEFFDLCICFGYGVRHNYKTQPETIETCDRCNGAGYLIRTHAHDKRCEGAFPEHCTVCGCACYDCKRTRTDRPRWSEFEKKFSGYPNKFVEWATDPFQTKSGAIYRIAIMQPWSTMGLIWQVCSVERGSVSAIPSSSYQSEGSFYDALSHECNEYQSGNAIVDAKANAARKMQQILSR